MEQQIIKRNNEGYENVDPKTYSNLVKDKNTNKKLDEILAGFNSYFVSYNGSRRLSRLSIISSLRRRGLYITYILYNGNIVTEYYNGSSIDDTSWGSDDNWLDGTNRLVGDISISSNGTWVINGVDIGLPARGEKGDNPILKVSEDGSTIQYSYNCIKWYDLLKVSNITPKINISEPVELAPGSTPTVENTGNDFNVELQFGLPKSPEVNIGSTTTIGEGNKAKVTNSGTKYAPILNFEVPKGDTGSGLKILGFYDTFENLNLKVTAPEISDTYCVGTAEPYHLYVWTNIYNPDTQETTPGWKDAGTMNKDTTIIVNDLGDREDVAVSQKGVTDIINDIITHLRFPLSTILTIEAGNAKVIGHLLADENYTFLVQSDEEGTFSAIFRFYYNDELVLISPKIELGVPLQIKAPNKPTKCELYIGTSTTIKTFTVSISSENNIDNLFFNNSIVQNLLTTDIISNNYNIQGGFRATDGSFAAGLDGFVTSGIIEIDKSFSYRYIGSIFSSFIAGVTFYDSSRKYLSCQFTSDMSVITDFNDMIDIPENATYMALSGYTNNDKTFIIEKYTIKGVTDKAKHGYSENEKIKTLKNVDDSIKSIFKDNGYTKNIALLGNVDETKMISQSQGGLLVDTNGSFGVITDIPVEEGKTYCYQGKGHSLSWIVGRTIKGYNTGFISVTQEGEDYDYWATFTIPEGLNIDTIIVMFYLPYDNRQIMITESETPSAYIPKIIKETLLPNTGVNNIYYVDCINGNDSNDGLHKSSAFKTFSRFIELAKSNTDNTLYIASGIYTETLDTTSLKGNLKIMGIEGESVIIKGSDSITNWSIVEGYENIYYCDFDGSIPVYGNFNDNKGVLIENGRNSMPITIEDRHPAHKGLEYRLPFTLIQQISADNLSSALEKLSTESGWYYDELSKKLYLRTTDGNNPNNNGYSYENIVKSTFLCSKELTKLYISNISFRFTTPITFYGNVERYNCSVFCSTGSGFRDDVTNLKSYFDECAACAHDGEGSTYSSRLNWDSLDIRFSGARTEYYYSWCHDNLDDGLSCHSASHLYILGGLYEYNGDSGIRPSNTCVAEIHDTFMQHNGKTIGEGFFGAGFDIVNPALDNDIRKNCSAVLYNCVSQYNRKGFGITNYDGNVKCVNCSSYENSEGEYYVNSGNMHLVNCKAFNSQGKVKVENGGNINILNIVTVI